MDIMDGDHLSVHCPHCGKHTAVSPAPLAFEVAEGQTKWDRARRLVQASGSQDLPLYHHVNGGRWWMGKCNACSMPMLVKNDGRLILPTPQPAPVDSNIPEPMQSDLLEAKQCIAVGAWNAAVVMGRRALQCACVERGAPSGQLHAQIKWLDENRKITTEQRQWADAARWVGNHGAHDTEPNLAEGRPVITDVSETDAADTVDLVEHLFETLYVAAHKAREQLAKRGKLPPS